MIRRLLTVAAVLGVVAAAVVGYLRLGRGVSEIRPTRPIDVAAEASTTPRSDAAWPAWRGEVQNVVTLDDDDATLPSPTSENLRWQTPLPGRGHSTPCLADGRLYVTLADDAAESIRLAAVAVEDGRIVWQTELEHGGLPEIHAKNTHASASPATDGRAVYAVTAAHGVLSASAVDRDGRLLWKREVGPYQSQWGYGSSPALCGSLLIVVGENKGAHLDRLAGSSFVAAVERTTGEIVWRVKRPPGDSFGSPLVANVAGRRQLILAGKESVDAYDPASGEQIWTCRRPIDRGANTVAVDAERVYASGTLPTADLVCVRADGAGDVSDTHVAWREKKGACDVPSPVLLGDKLYSLGDDGVLSCLAIDDGRMLWKRRLGGNFSSSPLVVGTRLLCGSEDGKVFVIETGDDEPKVDEFPLDAGLFASPIYVAGQLFLRTETDVRCYAAPPTQQPTVAAQPAASPR